MYNENLKGEFITLYAGGANSARKRAGCERLFREFERFEEQWGADLCTKDEREIANAIYSMDLGIRSDTRIWYVAALNKYRRWCKRKEIPGAVYNEPISLILDRWNINEYKDQDVELLRKRMVTNPKSLQEFLDRVFNKEDLNTIDNVYRCMFWIAYCGCPEDQLAINIRRNDVDFRKNVFTICGKEFQMYRESVASFKQCAESDSFLTIHPIYNENTKSIRPRVSGDLLLRGIRTQPDVMKYRNAIHHKNKRAVDEGKTEIRLNYKTAWLSGIYFRKMQEEMIAGDAPDFLDVAEEYMMGKEYKEIQTDPNEVYRKRKKARLLKMDYTRWKLLLSDELLGK